MGTMTLSGRTPTSSSFTITAGRVFCISAPRVGERLMSQISPRCMEILAVQGGEGGQVGIVLVIGPQGFGGGRQATGNRAGRVMRLALLAQRAGEVLQHLELLLEGQRLDFTNDFCSNHGVNSLDRVRTSRIWFNMAGAQ